MEPVKISSKNQVVIPKAARDMLGLRAGDEIFFVSRNGVVYLLPKMPSLTAALKGQARGKMRYPSSYLKRERDSW